MSIRLRSTYERTRAPLLAARRGAGQGGRPVDPAGGGGAAGRAGPVQRPARPDPRHRGEHPVRAAQAARTGGAAGRPALLRPAAAGGLRADRGGQGPGRGAPPAGALGRKARRPGRGAPAPRVRHPGRGPLVLPDLRPPGRPRLTPRRAALRLTPLLPREPVLSTDRAAGLTAPGKRDTSAAGLTGKSGSWAGRAAAPAEPARGARR